MFTAADYRTLAIEHLEAARSARSEERRKHYLDMAKLWTSMAASLEGGDILQQISQTVGIARLQS